MSGIEGLPVAGNVDVRRGALIFALGFVLTGLAGRALIDKLLALRGGAELVAHWAQVNSLAEMVAGVTLAGIGIGLTGRVAGVAPYHQRRLLGDALRLGLTLSGICLAVLALLAVSGLLPLLLPPHLAPLVLPALAVGWIGVAPGLLIAWLLGRSRPGRAIVVVAAQLSVPLFALWLARPGGELAALLGGQALFGTVATLLLLIEAASAKDPAPAGHGLRPFVAAGIAIGILSPVALAIARLEIAASASWEAVGAVQALWRTSEWITAVAAGLLNAYFLPRLAAAKAGPAFAAELRAAARQVLRPALLALVVLWLLLPQVLALLYREGLPVGRFDALPFFAGDALRMLSWIFLFGLFARGAGWAVTAGELLSLPLFAALLVLLPGSLSLPAIGVAWMLAYVVYAGFNYWALRRSQAGRQ
ncbi:MAG: polysaccharide transporter PST family [Rhodocyclaceae bacterium]|nr:MAG: polysaccharide transporter PST family [Rhodocyclaceae bacterium]TND03023.1 MAG: polysaccharide transporter, PST family [Rhodocyclaceae bacterium]